MGICIRTWQPAQKQNMFYNMFLYYPNHRKCINFTRKIEYCYSKMKKEQTLSGLLATNFSKTVDGKEVSPCVLVNNRGCKRALTNHGATIVSLMVPGRNGEMTVYQFSKQYIIN